MEKHTLKNQPMFMVDIPFPYGQLSPNNVKHPKAKMKWVKQARQDARLLAQAQRPRVDHIIPGQKLISLRIFFPPDNRRRDLDNLGAMVKAYQDGLFDYLSSFNSKIDDHQVIGSLNFMGPVVGKQKAYFIYYLIQNSPRAWIEKIPTLVHLAKQPYSEALWAEQG